MFFLEFIFSCHSHSVEFVTGLKKSLHAKEWDIEMFMEVSSTTQYSSLMGHNILLVFDIVSFPTVSTDSVDDVISTL